MPKLDHGKFNLTSCFSYPSSSDIGCAPLLAPQPRVGGVLADDIAKQGFYVLAMHETEAELPVVVGAQEWLAEQGVEAVVVRPDGYVLKAFN